MIISFCIILYFIDRCLSSLRDKYLVANNVADLRKDVANRFEAAQILALEVQKYADAFEYLDGPVTRTKVADDPSKFRCLRRNSVIYIFNFNTMNQTFHSIKGH